MEEFLATAADTAERLRSKHVRTLEAMQKLINENNELKAAAVGGPSRAVVDDVGIASLRADLEVQRASSERAVSKYTMPHLFYMRDSGHLTSSPNVMWLRLRFR